MTVMATILKQRYEFPAPLVVLATMKLLTLGHGRLGPVAHPGFIAVNPQHMSPLVTNLLGLGTWVLAASSCMALPGWQ